MKFFSLPHRGAGIFAVALCSLVSIFSASAQTVVIPHGSNGEPPFGVTYKQGFQTLTVNLGGDAASNQYDPEGPWGQNTPTLQTLGGGSQPNAVVPEPASATLLLIAGAAAIGLRLRRKNR